MTTPIDRIVYSPLVARAGDLLSVSELPPNPTGPAADLKVILETRENVRDGLCPIDPIAPSPLFRIGAPLDPFFGERGEDYHRFAAELTAGPNGVLGLMRSGVDAGLARQRAMVLAGAASAYAAVRENSLDSIRALTESLKSGEAEPFFSNMIGGAYAQRFRIANGGEGVEDHPKLKAAIAGFEHAFYGQEKALT